MNQSESIDQLATALSKVQAALVPALKDAENPAFKQGGKASRYADLASVWDACRGPLTENGLAVIQSPGLCGGNQVEMTTIITHASGQWISGTLSIPLAKVDAHGYGSATTYARRYALAAMIGVIADDDDGNAASKPSGAANDEPAARAKLDGPHESKTALRTAVHAIIASVRAAGSEEEIAAIKTEHKRTINQALRDWPILVNGDRNIAEDVGLIGAIEQRKAALADAGQFDLLLDSMKSCTSLATYTNWRATNEAIVDELDDRQRKAFEAEAEAFETSLAAVAAVNAG